MGNGLRDAVIGELKISCFEAGDHLAAGIADGDGSVDEDNVGGDFVFGFYWSLLDGYAGARREWAFGGLGETW